MDDTDFFSTTETITVPISFRLLERHQTTRFPSHDRSDRTRYVTTGRRRGSWQMTAIHTLRLFRIMTDRIAESLTLHDVLSATASWGAIAGRRKLKIV